MQRLLEETLLFDISLQNNDLSNGDPWSYIQSQMNKILLKPNSLKSQSLNVKPNHSPKVYKKMEQSRHISKFYPINLNRSHTYPVKSTKIQLKSLQKDQIIEQNKLIPVIDLSTNQMQKIDKQSENTSLMKLQLLLVQKDKKIKDYFQKKRHIGTEENKIADNQNCYQYSYRNIQKKEENIAQNNQKNIKLLANDIGKLICSKKLFSSERSSFQFNPSKSSELDNRCQAQDTDIQGIINLRKNNSNKINNNNSFQSLRNFLKTQKKPHQNSIRKNISELLSEKAQKQKIKTLRIAFKGEIRQNKSHISMMGSDQQIRQSLRNIHSFNKFPHYQVQKIINTSIYKLLNQNVPKNDRKQKSISHNPNSILYKKQSSGYLCEILELKNILKEQNQKKWKVNIQKKQQNNTPCLPLIKLKSQSDYQTKKSSFSAKNKYSTAQIKKKCTNLKFKSQTKIGNKISKLTQNNKNKNQDLHLILVKDKKMLTEASQKVYKKPQNPREQNQILKNNSFEKITISSILNGKFNINQYFSKNQLKQDIVSNSYLFPKYKSLDNYKSTQIQKDKKQGKKIITFKQRPKFKSELYDSCKNKKNHQKNLFNQRNQFKSDQKDSIGRIINKRNELALLHSQNEILKENIIDKKKQIKWNANIVSEKDKQKKNKDLLINKNLDAQNNISIFKFSLNRNKNKLVIIRR